MGSRTLRNWLLFPLISSQDINSRLDTVDFFKNEENILNESRDLLSNIGDLERMLSKISTSRITPRELVRFKDSLITCDEMINYLDNQQKNKNLKNLLSNYSICSEITVDLESKIEDDAPVNILKGGSIKSGVSNELDKYRELASSSEKVLDEIKNREIEKTGISSLKIAYNNVFGYYLEVRNTHKDKVPSCNTRNSHCHCFK